MNKSAVFGIAILWASAIIATALLVKGTPHAESVIAVLSGCAFASTCLLPGACRQQCPPPTA
jgi:hypothetical protein